MATSVTIRPFRIDISEAALTDLRTRLAGARWPAAGPTSNWSRGVPLDYLRTLADYWRTEYDWRAQERALNRLPQFTADVGGQTVHFAHIRSPEVGALPLVLSHGYPSSFAEFHLMVGPLTDPGAHGGDPADAFHLVIPSLVGFPFSQPVSSSGWDVGRTGRAVAAVMAELGYDRYGVHGGDAGAGVSSTLNAAGHTVGQHAPTDPASMLAFLPLPDGALTPTEQSRLDRMLAYRSEYDGYLRIQSTRPQTIAYALQDSPVGQLAWIAEKYAEWTHPSSTLPEEAVDIDHLLTTIALYWFTGAGASAAHFLYDAAHSATPWGDQGSAPSGFSVFGVDADTRTVVHRMRPALDPDGTAFWSEHAEAGHFPAMESPTQLVGDLRAFFRDKR